MTRHAGFALYTGLVVLAFWTPLRALLDFALEHEYGSHILVVPFLSVFLVYLRREHILRRCRNGFGAGAALLLAGMVSYWVAQRPPLGWNPDDRLSATVFPIVLVWIAGFALFYGTRALRAGAFPLLFLFLMVPIPSYLLDKTILVLQAASTEVTEALFWLVGVPLLRQGFVLALPGLTIEVAKECSGIRSSMALLITCLLAGYLGLRPGWRRAVLVVAALPIAVFKNGVRIVTLTLLAIYVDPGFLTGTLHRNGGVVFFLLALGILLPVLRLLQKSEKGTPVSSRGAPASGAPSVTHGARELRTP